MGQAKTIIKTSKVRPYFEYSCVPAAQLCHSRTLVGICLKCTTHDTTR